MASPPRAPKRSQSVYLTTMAGAGAAALGIYALAPNASCPEGRLYPSLDQCLAAGAIAEGLCRDGFQGRTDPVLFRGPTGADSFAAVNVGNGVLRLSDGSFVNAGELCRSGSGTRSSTTSNRSGSSSRGFSSFFSSSDDGASSSRSLAAGGGSGGGEGHAVSRGGFGSIGHAFSGGG